MSGISLTASFFYCHPEAHTLQDVRHSGSRDRCVAVLIMEMLESIVGENEPQVKFEPYGTNEPSEMLKQAGHSRKRVLLVPYASRSTSFALGNYRLQHDLKEGEDHQVQHDEHMGRGR